MRIFFAVYKKISGNDTMKAAILKKGEELDKRVQEQPATTAPGGDATNQQLENRRRGVQKTTSRVFSHLQGVWIPTLQPPASGELLQCPGRLVRNGTPGKICLRPASVERLDNHGVAA